MSTVYHPTIPDVFNEVEDDAVEAWKAQGWLKSAPKNAAVEAAREAAAKGGWHMVANLRPICRACNNRKSARWPLTPALLAAIRERRPWNPAEEVARADLHSTSRRGDVRP
jgi:hypothetical protein